MGKNRAARFKKVFIISSPKTDRFVAQNVDRCEDWAQTATSRKSEENNLRPEEPASYLTGLNAQKPGSEHFECNGDFSTGGVQTRSDKVLPIFQMALQVTIRQGVTPRIVEDERQLDEVLKEAADEARSLNFLGAVLIKADNGNYITMVVGGQETVLGFDSGDLSSCYASKGASDAIEPLMTGFFMMWHHTEFPRKNVIPLSEGIKAVREFLDSGGLPTCINWEEL